MTYALVTGASKGIGKAIALELAAKKYNVLLVARSEADLKDLCTEIESNHGVKAFHLAIDLSEQHAAKVVFDWVKEKQIDLSVLVNNAGYGLSGFFEKYKIDEVLNMMQLNMQTLVQFTSYFLPELKKSKQAYILNIASTAAYQSVPGLSAYAASKSFVLSFSRGLHQELRGSNVSVTCISPGATDTAFVERANLGEKGLKAAEKVNMQPKDVAKIGVDALFDKKAEVVAGAVNKLGIFFAWLLPKTIVERVAMNIYK
ncbi:MAG: SDR family oxidoreductase [Pedobacter sp.]|nr:MAG: SDR family oxidoreductase [Pedobacter sp.]